MPSSLSIILLTSLMTLVNARQQCYYPDGSLSTTDTPCNSSATTSACCKSSAYCLANGICLENGILNRESCTDKNWTSDSCPQYCKSESTSSTSSPIMPCTNTTFTCGLYPNDCAASASTFQLLGANDIILRPSQLNSAISTSSGIQSNNNNSSITPSSPPPQSHLAIIATSLGLSLPLLLVITILSYLLFREKKRQKAIDLHNDQAFYRHRSSTPGIREINTCSWSAWSDRTPTRGRDDRSVLESSIRELSPTYQRYQQQQVF